MDKDEILHEDRAVIEQLLQDYIKDYSISINTIECSAGSRLGDNYMSIIKRVTCKGKSIKIADFNCTVIIKRQIPSISRRQLFRCDEAFANEIAAYCHLIPVFRTFSNNHVPYPNCLFAGIDNNSRDLVVLEDLTLTGFKMVNRLKGLDYPHCKIVMQELGNLHAISLAMKYAQPAIFDSIKNQIKDVVYCNEAADFYSKVLDSSLNEALNSLRITNVNGDLDLAIAALSKLSGKLYQDMYQIVNEKDERQNVICHGDVWVNNLMFKYDSSSEVKAVRLIDLQAVRYASPVIDILHFIYSSTELVMRNNCMEQLLEDYATSLCQSFRHYLSVHRTPVTEISETLEPNILVKDLKRKIQLKALYGLGTSMWLLPAVTFHTDKIPDLDSVQLTDFTNSNQEKVITEMHTPEYRCRMKETVLEFYTNGLLNL